MVDGYTEVDYLRWIVAMPALVVAAQGVFLIVLRRALPQRMVVRLSCGAALLSLAISSVAFAQLIGLEADPLLVDVVYTWIGAGVGNAAFSADVALQFDALSAAMCFLVTGIGLVVHVYASESMRSDEREDAGFQRYFCYANLLLTSLLVLVLADSLPLMLVGWQGVGLCSYLLIGFWYSEKANASAATRALVVNRIGDVGLLMGVCLLFWALADAGVPAMSFRGIEASFAQIAERTVMLPAWLGGSWTLPSLIGLCLFFGAVGNSGQVPLQFWVADAMAGPIPGTALIHALSAAVGGIYLLCRLSFVYAVTPELSAAIAWVGGVTAVMGALFALVQTDIRKVLASSTMSQVGLMFLAVGCGAYSTAIFHLVSHALFKTALFLGAGVVILALHNEHDLRRMGGLRGSLVWTHVWMLVAVLAIAGMPLSSGFFSAGEILASAYVATQIPGNQVLYGMALLTVGLTSLYAFRLLILAFWGEPRAVPNFGSRVVDPRRRIMLPLAALAISAYLAGLLTPPQFWGDIMIPGENSDSLGNFLTEAVVVTDRAALESGKRWALVGHALLAVTLGFALAFVLYVHRPKLPEKLAERVPWLHAGLLEGGYVKFLYRRLLVRPLAFVSQKLLYQGLDQRVVNGTVVNGSARLLTNIAEHGLKYVQSGLTQGYFVTLLLGALAIAGYLML
jgi:NADH-quinone oxidoreductase subunit L